MSGEPSRMSDPVSPGRVLPAQQSRGARRWLLIAAAASAGLTLPAFAQQWTGPPPVTPDLKAALDKADAGSPDALLALADGGRADAQFYAGVMFMFGRKTIPKDGPRGCAYEEKASATRADAMHLVGLCFRDGIGGVRDAEKAKAAFARAADMGFPQSKCALGQMLIAEPGQADRGLQLCKDSALAGDVDAQVLLGSLYFDGGPVKPDHAEARKWFAMAAGQKNPDAARRLGQMYADGDGGPKDIKKAMELWQTAEAAGDPTVAILVADQLFSDLTGGRTPGAGKYAFRGGIPVNDINVTEDWYKEAQNRDPRPEVKQRAKTAIGVLEAFKTAAQAQSSGR
jgi:TPR repeat protein